MRGGSRHNSIFYCDILTCCCDTLTSYWNIHTCSCDVTCACLSNVLLGRASLSYRIVQFWHDDMQFGMALRNEFWSWSEWAWVWHLVLSTMAADGEEHGEIRRRAVSLLQETTRFLAEYSGAGTAAGHQPQRTDETCTDQSGGDNRNTRVLQNFRSLFSPYGTARRLSPSSSVQSSCPPNKRGKWNSSPFKRETWTHEFFCLADRNRVTAPSKVVKEELQLAGLGRRKICFHWNADAVEVKRKLEEIFPKLKNGGGFEILRRGTSPSELSLIQPPRSGYSVSFLRIAAGLGQEIAFIRPLQANLSKDRVMQPEYEVGMTIFY